MNKYTLSLLFSVICLHGISQNTCTPCEKLLVQDYFQYGFETSTALHYLNIIDESNYYKNDTRAALGAEVIYEGIPITADMSYSKFDEYRSRLFKKTEFKYKKDESLNIIKREFSANTLSAFSKCIEACNSTNGLFVYLKEADDKLITIAIKYSPLSGSRDILKVTGTKFNGTAISIPDLPTGTKITATNNNEIILTFNRDRSAGRARIVIGFEVNSNRFDKDIVVPEFPRPVFYERVTLQENDNGIDRYIYNEEFIIEGYGTGDADGARGTVHIQDLEKGYRILFGPWENPTCKKSGSGWHIINVGSCGLSGGSKGLYEIKLIARKRNSN